MKQLVCLLLLFSCRLVAQEPGMLRIRVLTFTADTLRLDTLSIIPESFGLTDGHDHSVDPGLYHLDAAASLLVLSAGLHDDGPFQVVYRVFPYDFSRVVRHKDYRLLANTARNGPFILQQPAAARTDLFSFGDLQKNGSISRALSFGNSQDLVVNSNLNLQLAGRLTEDIEILAAITDENIPIQPYGNTQQVQDFDNMFIRLSTSHSSLTAGDFQLTPPGNSYFMKFQKKAKGVRFDTQTSLQDRPENTTYTLTTRAAASISKGQYARNMIQGREGIQGPYKLTGASQESFIIVLSGSEKVYIDGELLQRGQDHDYVIDYNLAEVTFMPDWPITKDKRFVVEFEYDNKNYARSLVYGGTSFENRRLSLRMNLYSEQDMKAQPVLQELDPQQTLLLSQVGDNLGQAIFSTIDSVQFAGDEIRYKLVDSLGVDSVLVYSTNPDSAFYRVRFSFVGQGGGSYLPVNSAANGKVFLWVGRGNGSYDPVSILTAPEKTQLATFEAGYQLSKRTKASFHYAISNHDRNTFSPFDSDDDVGFALKTSVENTRRLGSDSIRQWRLISRLSYEWINDHFHPVERYRPVEFERDWNMNGVADNSNEYILSADLDLTQRKTGTLHYDFTSFTKGMLFDGHKHGVSASLNKHNYWLNFSGSLLQTDALTHTSDFTRHRASLIKKYGRAHIGLRSSSESNRQEALMHKQLLGNSFAYREWEGFLSNADTADNKFMFYYRERTDRLPWQNELAHATKGRGIGAMARITRNTNQMVSVNSSLRRLTITDTSITHQKEENTLLSRLEYNAKFWKGSVRSDLFYEMASSLELKKEFSYLEVPAGQGTYTWTDFNQNGIKELDEFDVAHFSDQARYIRVYTPTNEYVKTYTNQFTEVLTLDPAKTWSRKTGFRHKLSKLMNRSVYSAYRKTAGDHSWQSYNPFHVAVSDTALVAVNSSFRNTLFFNKLDTRFGLEFNYQDVRNKTLLTSGFDYRTNESAGFRARWNVSRVMSMQLDYQQGTKSSRSAYFSSRDYQIAYNEAAPTITFQPSTLFRISFLYTYTGKINQLHEAAPEQADIHKLGLEAKLNKQATSSATGKFSVISNRYNAQEHSSLAYEMLEGLSSGINYTWNLGLQRNLMDNMQLNLVYEGRKSPESRPVHIGSVQVRAYF